MLPLSGLGDPRFPPVAHVATSRPDDSGKPSHSFCLTRPCIIPPCPSSTSTPSPVRPRRPCNPSETLHISGVRSWASELGGAGVPLQTAVLSLTHLLQLCLPWSNAAGTPLPARCDPAYPVIMPRLPSCTPFRLAEVARGRHSAGQRSPPGGIKRINCCPLSLGRSKTRTILCQRASPTVLETTSHNYITALNTLARL